MLWSLLPPTVSHGIFIPPQALLLSVKQCPHTHVLSVLLKINPRAFYLLTVLKTIHLFRETCGVANIIDMEKLKAYVTDKLFHKQDSNIGIPVLLPQLITLTFIDLSSLNQWPSFEATHSPTTNYYFPNNSKSQSSSDTQH